MPEGSEQEKASVAVVKSEYTKLKVAVGYFLLLFVVLSLAYITYSSFYKIIDSTESLGNNKNESSLVIKIASEINEVRTSSKIYSITFKYSDYKIYQQRKELVYKLMDTLSAKLGEGIGSDKADSLNLIFREYIICINNWLTLKKADSADDYNKIAAIIKEQDDSLTHSKAIYPHLKTTTVTKLLEKPVAEDSAEGTDALKINPPKTFLQKVFGNRNKKKETRTPSSNLLNQQIITKKYTEADTNYYNQVDLVLSKIKDTLTNTENNKKIRGTQLARLEFLLLDYQTSLISKINHLLKNIELEDQAILNKSIYSSKQTVKRASKILVNAELAALLIALVFVYVIFNDLTKSAYYKQMLEKEKLETEKLAKAKEDFLTMMSHEIRTPLTNIIGISELLEGTSLKVNQEKQVQSIVNSSEHLLAIVNDILDYTKIKSGSLTFEKIGFCINDIISEALQILSNKAGKKELQLIHQPLGDFAHILFLGDPFRLKQVLLNLVGNGIKFTEKGYIKIETSVTESNQGYLLGCNVIDTGIGIDADKLQTIFSDFSQADNSIARKYGGTGLGLPISKKIVEMQNGSIWVNSVPGQGSVFSFKIPYFRANENDYSVKHGKIYQHGEQLKNKKILVIDDDPMLPLLLEPMFQSWLIDYNFYSKSVEAWNMLQEKVFDIIMVDIQMHEMDGFEVIRRIRTNDLSKNKAAKIVVCTANVVMDTDKSARLISGDFVLYKPFKNADLWNILCESLGIQVDKQYVPSSFNSYNKSGIYSLKNFTVYANDDKETLMLFIKTFISQTKKELAEMQNYFLNQNFDQVREITHKLKNTFGQLEANELLFILTSLESSTMMTPVDIKKIDEQIVTLQQACQYLFILLEKEALDLDKH
jgi:signal transduction histidine kinase/response regulator RpfG family c-di-GMP phosphodiesterase